MQKSKCKQVLFLLSKVQLKDHTNFLTPITRIMTFSLNLDTSIKNFQTTKYSLERSFQENENIMKKISFTIF